MQCVFVASYEACRFPDGVLVHFEPANETLLLDSAGFALLERLSGEAAAGSGECAGKELSAPETALLETLAGRGLVRFR